MAPRLLSIGSQIQAAREARGWNVDELAVRAGMSRRMLAYIERGVTNPGVVLLLRLADTLEIDITLHEVSARGDQATSPLT